MFKTKTINIDLFFLVWVIWILVIRICLVLRAWDFEFDIEPAPCAMRQNRVSCFSLGGFFFLLAGGEISSRLWLGISLIKVEGLQVRYSP